MTDDRKYSSLYSAIQGIGKRSKRSSEASPTSREGSPARRENTPIRRQSSPAPHLRSSQEGSVLKVPHVLENEDSDSASIIYPGGSRVGSVVKIPQATNIQEAIPPLPSRASSRQAPASSFFALDSLQNSRASLDDAARQSAGPQVSRSSASTPLTDLNRSSQMEMGSLQVAETKEYDRNQKVLPRASQISPQKVRLSIPPVGTTRSPRTSGRQSQYRSPNEAVDPKEALPSTSPRVSQFPTSISRTDLNESSGAEMGLFQVTDTEEYKQSNVPPRASSQNARFSVPPSGTNKSSRKSGRQSQFMSTSEVKESQGILPSTSSQVSRASSSTPFTDLNRGAGGEMGLFQAAKTEDYDQNQEVPTSRASSQKARFSVAPAGTTRSSRTKIERQSQYMSPGETVEPQEVLLTTSPQILQSSASTPFTGLNCGSEAQQDLFQIAEAEEYDENPEVPPQASHASLQQFRFTVPSAGTTRSSRASGRQSEFTSPSEAIQPQEMLQFTRPQALQSYPLTDSNHGFGAELGLLPVMENEESYQNREVPPRTSGASSQQARFSVPPSDTARSSRISGRQPQSMSPDEAVEPQEILPSAIPQDFRSSPSTPFTGLNHGPGTEMGLSQADQNQEVPPLASRALSQKARTSVHPVGLNRRSEVQQGLFKAAEAKEHNENQDVLARASRASSQQVRFPMPPAGTTRSSRKSARQSQFMSPGEAIEAQEILQSTSPQVSRSSTFYPFTDSNHGLGAEPALLPVTESEDFDQGQEVPPRESHPSSQQVRFSVPPSDTPRSSRVSGRQSQFINPDEAVEPQELPSATPQVWQSSPSYPFTDLNRASGAHMSLFQPEIEYDQNQEVPPLTSRALSQKSRFSGPPAGLNHTSEVQPSFFQVADAGYDENEEVHPWASHASSRELRFSVPPAGTTRSSRTSGRQSQFISPGEAVEPKETLLSTRPQVLQSSTSYPFSDSNHGFGAELGSLSGSESEEYDRNCYVPPQASFTSSQLASFSVQPAGTTRNYRTSERQSQFMRPGEDKMLPSTTPLTDLNRGSGAEMGLFQAETEYDQNQEVPSWASDASSQRARLSVSSAGTTRSSRTSGRKSQFMGPGEVVEPQEMFGHALTQNSRFSVTPLVGSTRRSRESNGQGEAASRFVAPDESTDLQERASSISSPGSQVEAESSPRSHSLVRISSAVDSEPDVSLRASTNDSFVNANQHSRAGSAFANPEMFGPAVYPEELPPAHKPDSLDQASHRMQQSDRRLVSPRNSCLTLADLDAQTSQSSQQVPRIFSQTSEQRSRSASPSHRFSQVSGSRSVRPSIDQGSRLSSMPLQVSPARSSQIKPKKENEGEMLFRTSVNRPMVKSFQAEAHMALAGVGTEDSPVYSEHEPQAILPEVEHVESSFGAGRNSRTKSYIGQGIKESQVPKGADLIPPKQSNQLSSPSYLLSVTPSNQGLGMSSSMLSQGFEDNLYDLGSARRSQAEALPAQQYMAPCSMALQDAEPQEEEDDADSGEGQVIGYEGMASPRVSMPSKFLSVASADQDDPYNQVRHSQDSVAADTTLSITAIPRDSSDSNGSQRKGLPFMQAAVAGEAEGAQSASSPNSRMTSNALDASGIQPVGGVRSSSLAVDSSFKEASLTPNQYLQRPSSLSFSKQIQKRGSLGMALTSRESKENMLNDISNTPSDSSSEELGQDKKLSLESISKPSFSARLSEQQSMIRPWDTEMLVDTERRMSHAFEDPKFSRPESADAISTYSRASTENMPRTIGVLNQTSESLYGTQSFGLSESNDQQGEERTRGSPRPSLDVDKSLDIGSLHDPENLSLLSSNRKSLVQEFIYPTSSPRDSFHENISPRTDQRGSSYHDASYQSSSPRISARQSLSNSKKDLTELQTQEFMYSPSLARTTLERDFDQVQDQAMQQRVDIEMNDAELPSQDLMYSPQYAGQSFEPILPGENDYDEVQYEDPTYSRGSFQKNFEQEDHYGEIYPSLQQQDSNLLSGVRNEDEPNDEECFDDARATEEHDNPEDLEEGDRIDDWLSPPPKDDLRSESFTNLEDSLGSFKRAFGSSTSLIKVPFGASELSYEGFAKVQFMEPTAGIWPVVWKSVAMQDLIRFSKDPLTQPLLQRLAAAPHKQCAVTSFTRGAMAEVGKHWLYV